MFSFFWGRTASVMTAVIYILLGIVLLVFPEMVGTVFCWALAVGTAIYAGSHFWRYFRSKKEANPAIGEAVLGGVFLIAAVVCLLNPHWVLSVLPWLLGVLLLLDGIGKLPVAVETVRATGNARLPVLFSALLPLILGIVLVANPFGAARTVIMFFGASLIVGGAFDLATAYYVR